MAVQVQTIKTSRFQAWSTTISGLAFLTIVAAMFASLFLQKRLIKKSFLVTEGQPFQSDLIQYQPSAIGALRIDARATLPRNYWVTYEVQILDQEGQILASALKQAWREAGTWREGGESGSWDESDSKAGLSVKSNDAEVQPIRVAIAILESGRTNNQTDQTPIPFALEVYDGSVDIRYLWTGFWGTLVISVLTWISSFGSRKTVIQKVIPDSDVSDRAMMGGAKTLIQASVQIQSDETTPRKLNIDLSIINSEGVTIFQNKMPVNVRIVKDSDGRIDGGRVNRYVNFLLEPRDSYRFDVEVTPDRSVDKTKLIVWENVRTLAPAEIIRIQDYR